MASNSMTGGNLVQINPAAAGADVEELIRQRVQEERRRLEQQAGLAERQASHFHKPIERDFTAD